MDTRPTFVAHTQPPKPVQPREGPLDHPAGLAEATAVRLAALRQVRRDASPVQVVSMGL